MHPEKALQVVEYAKERRKNVAGTLNSFLTCLTILIQIILMLVVHCASFISVKML